MRNPPLLEHTGTGLFTITNYRDNANYSVYTLEGVAVAGVTITDGVINMGNVRGEYYLAFTQDTALRRATPFRRASITYTTTSTTTCSPNCRPISGNCFDGSGSCQGDGSCGADGTICCGGSRGETCNTTTTTTKDPVPAGYTEQYGEWVDIDNPESTRAVEEPAGFSLPKVEWDPRYYVSRPLPTPNKAVDENGEEIEGMPAWDYDAIYFIHYDNNGDVVWTRENSHNPECFTIVENQKMVDYEIRVSNLPPANEGTYEFAVTGPNGDVYMEVGNV